MAAWQPPFSDIPPACQPTQIEHQPAQLDAIANVDGITVAMKNQLRDLVTLAKKHHSPGSAVSDNDMTKFVEMVMFDWTTKRDHRLPGKDGIRGSIEDRSINIGRLNRDLPVSSRKKTTLRLADKHKVTKNQPVGTQTDHWRK